jgi:hypothetical protein
VPVPFVSSKHESDAEHDKLPPSPSLLMYVLQKRVATSTRAMGSVKGLCTDFLYARISQWPSLNRRVRIASRQPHAEPISMERCCLSSVTLRSLLACADSCEEDCDLDFLLAGVEDT